MFFIADNERVHLASLQRLVRAVFPEEGLWPVDAATFKSWKAVADELAVRTQDDERLVIILDLGLESEEMPSVRAGVEQAFGIRSFRQNATIIAYTQWPELAEMQAHYSEAFDGLIDKQRLNGFDTFDEQQIYIRQIVSSVTRRKRGFKPTYTLTDSVGMRFAIAAFGEQVFDFLVQEIAPNWEHVRFAALTSGNSGAFLLSVSGTLQGGAQRIIVKCARDAELIRPDIRVRDFLAELGPLAEALAPTEHELHPLPRNLGHYYRQAEIQGEPLLAQLAGRSWDADAQRCLDGILSIEIRCYDRPSGEPFARIRPEKRFPLTPVDRGRASNSLKFLNDVGGAIQGLGQWPSTIESISEITDGVSSMLSQWDSILTSEEDLLGVGQHGDLNPGNVLVPTPGKIVLIDFARRGRWPVGYDIARLATGTSNSPNGSYCEQRLG